MLAAGSWAKWEPSKRPRRGLSSAGGSVPPPVAEPRRLVRYVPSGRIWSSSLTPARTPCLGYVIRVSPVGRGAPPVGGTVVPDGVPVGMAGTDEADADGVTAACPG